MMVWEETAKEMVAHFCLISECFPPCTSSSTETTASDLICEIEYE